jgi:hypothetical protein
LDREDREKNRVEYEVGLDYWIEKDVGRFLVSIV